MSDERAFDIYFRVIFIAGFVGWNLWLWLRAMRHEIELRTLRIRVRLLERQATGTEQ